MTKYSGTNPHKNTNIDDGAYHNSFTDVRMSVRYNLIRKGAVITPYVGSVVPSHDYAFYGHSAFGEQLNELQVGTFIAKLFTSGVPGMFVSSRIAYGFVEKVLDISHNRSVADLEAGYFFSPSFRAFGMMSGQYTHGGIRRQRSVRPHSAAASAKKQGTRAGTKAKSLALVTFDF